jgi:hypothetical protein
MKLGVSAGILGTGTASSCATFGIGIVVAVIVDEIVSRVWDWYADPKGNLTTALDAKLDELHGLIVDGSEGVTGLRARLRQFAKQRSVVRQKVVADVLQAR